MLHISNMSDKAGLMSFMNSIDNGINYKTTELVKKNKIMAGIFMIIADIGLKYIHLDFTVEQNKFIQSVYFRRLTIFVIFWLATKDILRSLILSLVYTVLIRYFLNENSRFYIFKNRTKNQE